MLIILFYLPWFELPLVPNICKRIQPVPSPKHEHLIMNLTCLSVCLFVSNKRQNGWTDQVKIFVGSPVTTGKVYGWSNVQKFASIKIYFWKFWKSTIFLLKILEIFCFCYLLTRRTPVYFISNKNFYKWNKRWARNALNA